MINTFNLHAALLLLLAVPCCAQHEATVSEELMVLARPWRDSIALRWAPPNARAWITARRTGYRIERVVVTRNGKLLDVPEMRVLHPRVLPLEEQHWQDLVPENPYAAVAAQAMFGASFELDIQQSDVFSIVDKVRENEQRYSFALFCADMSPDVAGAAGLWFTDRDVNAGERYLYRVIVNGADSLQGSIFTYPQAPYALPPPRGLTAHFQENVVSLKWENGAYSAYSVERADDHPKFIPVSKTPQVTASATPFENLRYCYAIDSLPNLYQRYHYRVRGITPFGEWSEPSQVVSGTAIRRISQNPRITATQNIMNASIAIEWAFPENDNALISGFEIERAMHPDETFTVLTPVLLPASTRSYRDHNPEQVNYYRIVARGLNGDAHVSQVHFAQLVDSIPPEPPQNLHAVVGDEGHVHLTWTENKEDDLFGYRVYRAYYSSEEPVQITASPIASASIDDTINLATLNDHAYYRVMAIDQSQNHSGLSDSLKVVLPDRVPPQPPVFLPAIRTSNGFTLRWKPSPSQDVVTYKVFRQEVHDADWKEMSVIGAGPDSVYQYTDSTLTTRALFTVIALDDAALESERSTPIAVEGKRATRSSISWKSPDLDRMSGKVSLTWKRPPADIRAYRLYRSIDDNPMLLHRQVDGDQSTYTEVLLSGRTYAYRILAIHRDGTMSALSDPLVVTY